MQKRVLLHGVVEISWRRREPEVAAEEQRIDNDLAIFDEIIRQEEKKCRNRRNDDHSQRAGKIRRALLA